MLSPVTSAAAAAANVATFYPNSDIKKIDMVTMADNPFHIYWINNNNNR